MRLAWMIGLANVVLLALLAGCGDDEPVCRGPNGDLAAGETFTDDCNTCTCNDDGSITCQEISDCAACSYEGQDYAVGDSWPKGDGCNFCQCLAFDDVSCTEAACTN